MKASKLYLFIREVVSQSEEKIQLRWIYAIAIISVFLNLFYIGWKDFPDSIGYVNAWDVFVSGKIDWSRTPVYPILLGILRTLVGKNLLYWAVVCVQSALFLLSVRYFYRLVKFFCNRTVISFWMTIFYCLVPGITSWNNVILTESLAITGSVFLFYFVIGGWTQFKKSYFVGFAACLCLLCMLRPSFLYLLPVFFCFWLVAFFLKGRKKSACWGLGGVVLVVGVVLCYSFAFQKTYGVFTPSGIGMLNQYCIVRQRDLLNPEVVTRSDLKVDIEKILESGRAETVDPYYKEFSYLNQKYSLLDVHRVVSASITSNLSKFIKETVEIAAYAGNRNVFDSYVAKPIVKMKLNILYLLFAVYTLFLAVNVWRRREVPYLSVFIYNASCSSLILVFVGAQEVWTRLLVPSVPLFLLMFSQLLSALNLEIIIKRKKDKFQLR